MVGKRKQNSYFDGSSSERGKGREYDSLMSKWLGLEEDESHMPNSLLRLKYQETASEPIRLQGKNGVFKVMVNKKKKIDIPSQHKKYDHREVEERGGSRSEDVIKKDFSKRVPVLPASRIRPENRGLFIDKEKTVKKEERGLKMERMKSDFNKGIKNRDLESDGTGTALKLAPPGPQVFSPKKVVIKEEKRPPPENVTPIAQRSNDKGKEGSEVKAKRGGSTEKQMLREKIRGKLIDAGI
ncbi:hypothetical protein BUALT_Bualt14G0102100 [Buddleja alternifolia]|uniref:Uncharacterized protein n=1 Tax=Buddleja alternifolia TaxID=168488 RepID=A0AAV6WN34_9LAMI|nr:hypothetical protein BUALT_Bualt14G0102100 [Buddleja alternifolia]